MIRVITYDSQGSFYECDRIIKLKNVCIDYDNEIIRSDGDDDFLLFGEIVKIEKQVKDCTFIELEKYVKTHYKGEMYKICRVRGFNKIVIDIEYDNYLEIKYLDLNEYIDITEVIKGGIR